MAQIDAFFKLMNEQGASDLHMMAGMPPILRIRGDMEAVKYKVMDNDNLKAMLYEICPEEKIKVFEETGDVDFGYEIPNLARYRANFFEQKNGVGAVFREIPSKILTCEQLLLPPVIPKLASLPPVQFDVQAYHPAKLPCRNFPEPMPSRQFRLRPGPKQAIRMAWIWD